VTAVSGDAKHIADPLLPNEDPFMSRPIRISRRLAIAGVLGVGATGYSAVWSATPSKVAIPPTPSCRDDHEEVATLQSAAGPYFKPDSPQRNDFIDSDSEGHRVVLQGQVISRGCQPLAGVLLDLWHADQRGYYDGDGFRYRGHTFTDVQGRYQFRTIEPAVYPGRTRHFHFHVQAPHRDILTTQLFFPGEPRNAVDPLFRQELLLSLTDTPALMSAQFNFVLEV
jgi:protocatechuate 3,4-dioxygenase beta subunit